MAKKDDQGKVLELQEAYANAYNEIVQPDRVFVASQYFRRQWVPLLGHNLAWLIVALRQRCYWNRGTGEVREWCRVSQDELAQEIGVTSRTLRTLLQHEHAAKFILEVKQTYRYDRDLGKSVRGQARYRIRMDDPLTPEDEVLLRQHLAEEVTGLERDPETGQRNMLALLDRMIGNLSIQDDLAEEISARSGGESPLQEKSSTRSDDLPEKVSARPQDLQEILSAILYGGKNFRTDLNTIVPDFNSIPDQQQQYPVAVVVPPGGLGEAKLAADQVIVPVYRDDHDRDIAEPLAYLIVPIAEVVKADIRAWHARRTNGGLQDPAPRRSTVYYSIAHALDEGPENEWTPDEQERVDQHIDLERELQMCLDRIGALSLEEALQQFFSDSLVDEFLDEASEAERARVEAWVVYTHRVQKRLTSPAGFLRSKIESDEWPPHERR